MIRNIEKIIPVVFIFFRIPQRIKKNIVQTIVSYKGVGNTGGTK
jgi:hypothetical protein